MNNILKLGTMAAVLLLSAACKDKVTERYMVNQPVYLSYESLRTSVKTTQVMPVENPGKLYFKDDYIFINEVNKGVHVIDNSDPENPFAVTFIEIPGNVDIAIKDSILYADSYIDLVALNVADIDNITEVNRLDSIFPYLMPCYEMETTLPYEGVDASQGVVVGWNVVEKTVEAGHSNPGYGYYPYYRWGGAEDMAINTIKGPSGSGFGVGGSMARFTLYDHYLYALNTGNLMIFDVATSAQPVRSNVIPWLWDAETLFPTEDYLFVGAQSGMYIYDLANPSATTQITKFEHARSCDPVVVEGNYAYVTLRSGTECMGFTNQLDVVNIENIASPSLVKSYPMYNPHGVGIDNGTLFVCDGDSGLKIYNAANPLTIADNRLAWYPDVHAYDVIPVNGRLLLIGTDGFYQYDYSQGDTIRFLSKIDIYAK